GWWSRSRRPRCAAGWPATRSNPGSIAAGSSRVTPTSPPRRPERWTSTPGSGTANPWARASSWCARMRRPRSRPGAAANPTLPPGKARMMRVEHEYQRRGALQYLAAYDVHRARVIGRLEPKTGIKPFARLVEQVMTTEPYASADRVFWIVDNGSSHRGRASVTRLPKAWPTAQLVH